jgi:hypothetical protein
MLLVFSGIFSESKANIRRSVNVLSRYIAFLVDAYPLYAASALAANSFARSSFAAAFPLFGVQSELISIQRLSRSTARL